MNAYDLYLVEDPADAADCERRGVYDFVIGGTECENCAMSIGPLDDVFVPCAIVRDDDETSWPICLDCIGPAILPGMWIGEN